MKFNYLFAYTLLLFSGFVYAQDQTVAPPHRFYIAPISADQLDFAIKNKGEELPAQWINQTIAKGDTLNSLKEKLKVGSYVIYTRNGKKLKADIYTRNSYTLTFYQAKNSYYLRLVDENMQPITQAKISSPDKKVTIKNNNGLYTISKGKKYFSPRIVVDVNGEIGFYYLKPAGSIPFTVSKKKKDKWQAMALLSQHQYRPLDTLRMSIAIFKRKKVFNEPLQVFMLSSDGYHNRDYKLNVTLTPNAAGVYSLNYQLPDSLDLDKNYTVYFALKKRKENESLSFFLKDYELDKTDVQVQAIKPNDSLKLAISVQDNNGFTRVGSMVQIVAAPSINTIYPDYLFVPNTFWTHFDTLKQDDILKVTVPDSLLNSFKGYIQFDVTIKTPTGEVFSERIYQSIGVEREFEVTADSLLHITYTENNKPARTTAALEYYRGDIKFTDSISVPYHEPHNENIQYYRVNNGEASASLKDLKGVTGNYSITTGKISFYLDKTQPKSIWYEVFKDQESLMRGEYSDTIRLDFSPKSTYWMKYSCVKNGAMQTEFVSYKPKPETLNLEVVQPETTQPGKAVSFQFTATDIEGKPVKNAIILGTSASSQMPKDGDYQIPQNNPYYNDVYPRNTNWVSHSSVTGFVPLKEVDQAIINLADFHAIYYPTDKVNLTYLPIDSAKHNKLTRIEYGQFWVRITDKKQKELGVYQVYVDGVLKYDLALRNPATMLISTGKHRIEVRTHNGLYTFKDVEIRNNEKLILSFNEDLNTQQLSKTRKRKTISKRHMYDIADRISVVQNMADQDIIVQSVGHFSQKLAKNRYYYSSISKVFISPLQEGNSIEILLENGTIHKTNFKRDVQYIVTNTEVLEMPLRMKTERQRLKKYLVNHGELETGYPYHSLGFPPKRATSYRTWNYDVQNYSNNNNLVFRGEGYDDFRQYVFHNTATDSSFMLGGSNNFNLPIGNYAMYAIHGDSFVLYQNMNIRAAGKNYYKLDPANKIAISSSSLIFDRFDTEKAFAKRIEGRKGIALELYKNENLRLTNSKVLVTTQNGREVEYTTDRLGQLFIPFVRDETVTIQPQAVCEGYSMDPLVLVYKEVLGLYFITKNWECPESTRKNHEISIKSYMLRYRENKFTIGNKTPSRKYRALACPSFGADDEYEMVEVSASRERKKLIEKDRNVGYLSYGAKYEDASDFNAFRAKKINMIPMLFSDADAVGDYFELGNVSLAKPAPEITIRTNFSDLGFWMPGVKTDEHGKASFTAKLPDDITTWRNLFITTDTKHRSATKTTLLKSYKPVMAQLHTPRFLIQGDNAWIKGELLSTTNDSLLLDYQFIANNETGSKGSVNVGLNYFVKQQLSVSENYANKEFSVQFQTTDNKQFADGEKRDIPIYPLGLLVKRGKVWELDASGSTAVQVNPADSSCITLLNTPKEMLGEMLKNVVNYEYNCNEQMASKVRALLLLLKYDNTKKQTNDYQKQLKDYVKQLAKNQQEDGSWGWWPNTRSNVWMTCYILEALYQANEAGYAFDGVQKARGYVIKHMGQHSDEGTNVLIVNMLLNINAPLSWDETAVTFSKYKSIDAKITAARLNYLLKQDSSFTELIKLKNTDILGHTYWGVDSMNFGSVHLQNTCNAYRLIKNNNKAVAETTQKYLWNRVYGMDENNTYEAIWLAETLFEDESKVVKNELCSITDGNGQRAVSYSQKTPIAGTHLAINNPNNEKVYAIIAHEKWETKPAKRDSLISITSSYTSTIVVGEPIEVQVKVSSKSTLGYVQIAIPIPAGCSYYGDQQIYNATHTEFYKDRVNIYVENLASGEHTFTFNVLPKYEGEYHINPASIELMYFPVIKGNNEIKKTRIE